ncbi:MAG: glycosyltransferase family 10 [Patescibacteria group bacterium]
MKKYLLCPFGDYDLNNKVFESPYGILRDLLLQKDISLDTYDLGNIETADAILFFNHHEELLRKCEASGVKKERLILFLFEPEVVIPKQYSKIILNRYGKIFTYRDDLIDNHLFFKLRYPQGQQLLPTLTTFAERKFLTFMNANKYSYVDNEIYSFRRQAIRYFDNINFQFDIYGPGWNDNSIFNWRYLVTAIKAAKVGQYLKDAYDGLHHYQSYRGTVDDKYSTLAQYKFVLCFENEKNVEGWISEKIFDCLFTGAIPIYLGASNIEKYVPSECFIDMRQFKSFSDLNDNLSKIDEPQFLKYQNAGQDFIRSSVFEQWQPKGVFEEIIKAL